MAQPRATTLPVHKVESHPDNPRQTVADDELLGSIREHGLYHPILAWRPTEQERWIVLSGHRRLEAFRRLNILQIPALIYEGEDLNEQTANFILLEANIKAKTLVDAEEGLAIARRMKRFGLTQAQIAEEYRISQSWVSKRIALVKVEERPRREDGRGRPSNENPEAFIPERISAPTIAVEVRSAPPAAQPAVAKAVEDKKLSRRETRKMVDIIKRVPEERQAEVAEKAAKTDNPVEAAKTLAAAAIVQSRPTPELDDLKSWLNGATCKYSSFISDMGAKLAFFLAKEAKGGPESSDAIRWSTVQDEASLERLGHTLSYLVERFRKDLDAIKAELRNREFRKESGPFNLTVLSGGKE